MASTAQNEAPQPQPDASSAKEKDASPAGSKSVSMGDLYMMGGRDPPVPKVVETNTPTTVEELQGLYTDEYAAGIDAFLETTWYTRCGAQRLLQDEHLKTIFASMVELFRQTTASNFEVMHQLPSTEARTVWELMLMARSAAADPGTSPAEQEELQGVVARLSVFEHLMTGQRLETNPLRLSESSTTNSPQQTRQLRFWHQLGSFTALPTNKETGDGDNPHGAALGQLRALLDGQENRDVLYSIAVTRHLGSKTSDFPDRVQPTTPIFGLNTADKNRLLVAKKHIEDQAAEQGTNQVVQRVCAMAARSWRHL